MRVSIELQFGFVPDKDYKKTLYMLTLDFIVKHHNSRDSPVFAASL